MSDREKPEPVTDDMLRYLDKLRESGATNMFGAAPWLENAFALSRTDARDVLVYWMETFEDRHPR